MTELKTKSDPAMDRALLARLTGALGDKATIAKLCSDFCDLYTEFLPDIFHSETGLTIEVAYSGHETGLMSELVAGLGDNVVLADTQLRNWSPHFILACDNSFVITLMENLLGALPETIEEPIHRPLSRIELDLSSMVFDKIANVLRSGVNAAGGFEPLIEKPHNAEDRGKPETDHVDEFAAAIKMRIDLGTVSSEFYLIVPQKALLKTVVTVPRSKNQMSRNKKEWAEQIAEQVRRSQITLEARVRLQTLTLNTISRLVAGDVIPFRDKSDVMVDVSANGKDMYRCEFGRAGEHYTVRVKDNVSSEDEILKHLMG
ncbi:flagellar motor switch protein FliM [Ciceribacter naphthalenivorans]|uniref:Flagellar motor switch protein FliM n=3 Tax=Alphaproteobacteria TaxID=28211 RepID=A0A512HDC0_9HYPH|nr:FliM/FliN family flagellar motor switch protein [Sphingomonas psychrolutea]GEO83453.1 flagellar motor switch protein FliM [Ciceribacter naphthalenivorans]GLR24397.1 flagellar motor switch protein FliM [Ciceribacter naphthalenivorans]GLT07253.1 flagellar motor switch protein FliM [Sphingomonas psychrolutea]